MGKWMFAFTVFWAYIGFGQYMLIWYANMPEETQFFLARNTQSWWWLSMLLVVGRFFGPFAILLLRSIKKHPHQLCYVAAWILFMQLLDMYIVILPAFHGTGVHLSVWDFVAARRHRRDARLFLSAHRPQDVAFSRARSAPDRIVEIGELTMNDLESNRQAVQSPAPFSTWLGVVLLFVDFRFDRARSHRSRAARRHLRTKPCEESRRKTEGVARGKCKGAHHLRMGGQGQGRRANSNRARDAIDRSRNWPASGRRPPIPSQRPNRSRPRLPAQRRRRRLLPRLRKRLQQPARLPAPTANPPAAQPPVSAPPQPPASLLRLRLPRHRHRRTGSSDNA